VVRTIALIILYGITDEDIVIQDNFAEGKPRNHRVHFLFTYMQHFAELILISLILIQPADTLQTL